MQTNGQVGIESNQKDLAGDSCNSDYTVLERFCKLIILHKTSQKDRRFNRKIILFIDLNVALKGRLS